MLGDIEVVLLTGGASRRMGADKASLLVGGEAMGARLVRIVGEAGYRVTVIGRDAISDAEFVRDLEEYQGPLAALGQFNPRSEFVFVMSCDLPRFDVGLIGLMAGVMGDGIDAVLPTAGGKLQPLVGLYRAEAWGVLRRRFGAGEKRVMSWVDRLRVMELTGEEIEERGGEMIWVLSANTPADFESILSN